MNLLLVAALLLLCVVQPKQSSALPINDIALAQSSRFLCLGPAFVCPLVRSDCASGSTSTTACQGQAVATNADFFENELRLTGGDVSFFRPIDGVNGPLGNDHKRQSLGVSFCITAASLNLAGTRTYTPLGPPDWENFPEIIRGTISTPGRTRGHLWGKSFGGHGRYYLNIVTLWSDVNQEMNSGFECLIKDAFTDLGLDLSARVFVTIHARYNGVRLSPSRLFLTADVEYLTTSGAVVKEPWLYKAINNVKGGRMETYFDRSSSIKAAAASSSASQCPNPDASSFISTLSFYPASSVNGYQNTGWAYLKKTGGPNARSDDGDVLFDARSQSVRNTFVQLTTKQSYVVGNGLSFQFLLRCPSSESDEIKLALPGGITLRITASGRSAAYVTYNAQTGRFDNLASSSLVPGYTWFAIHVVYRAGKTILYEDNVKKFERTVNNAVSIPFRLRFTNLDEATDSRLKVTNVVVNKNLNLRDA